MEDHAHRMRNGGILNNSDRPDLIQQSETPPNPCLTGLISTTRPAGIPSGRQFGRAGRKHKTHTTSPRLRGTGRSESQVAPGLFNYGRRRRFVPHLRSTLYCWAFLVLVACLVTAEPTRAPIAIQMIGRLRRSGCI